MTAKELAEAILKLPKKQQNLPIGFLSYSIWRDPQWKLIEYNDIKYISDIGINCITLLRAKE